jgi:hypothetical protein
MIHWDDPPAAATVAATTVAVTASHDETDGCLAAKEERGLLDAYLTLAVQPDGADVFYTSETIPNSTNPAFRIDMSLVDWYDGVQSMVMVCVCARHSLPESASMARQGDHSHASVGPPFNRLIEWSVDLDELVYIGKSVRAALDGRYERQLDDLSLICCSCMGLILGRIIRFCLNWMMDTTLHPISP